MLQAARQVRIGDEDAAEGDGVGVAVGDRAFAVSPVKPPAEINMPLQIGRNSTIADGTFCQLTSARPARWNAAR